MDLDSYFKIQKSFKSFTNNPTIKIRNRESSINVSQCTNNSANSELSDENYILQLLTPNSVVNSRNSAETTQESSKNSSKQSDEDFIIELLSQNSSANSDSTVSEVQTTPIAAENIRKEDPIKRHQSNKYLSQNSSVISNPITKTLNLKIHEAYQSQFPIHQNSTTSFLESPDLYNTSDNVVNIESQISNKYSSEGNNSQESTSSTYNSLTSTYKFNLFDDKFNVNTNIIQADSDDKCSVNTLNNNLEDDELTNDLLSELYPDDDFTQIQALDTSTSMEVNKNDCLEYKSQEEAQILQNRIVMRNLINYPTVNKINDVNIFDENYILKTLSSQIGVNNSSIQCDNNNNNSNNNNNKENNVMSREKPYIKRYRKGKTKIYRLKRRVSEETNRLSCITDDSKSECLSVLSRDLTQTEIKLRESIHTMGKNKSLLFNLEKNGVPIEPNKEDILMKIEEVLMEIFEAFHTGIKPVLTVPRLTYDNCIFQDNRLQLKDIKEATRTKIIYNNKNSREKFCLILHVMCKVKNLLETNTKLTKREIYYQIKHLIKNQTTSDRAISAVSQLLNVGQWSLNIIGGSGLIYGNLKLKMTSGHVINCNISGTHIPHDLSNIDEIQSDAKFILVTEKEAIFYKLIGELPDKVPYPFIMITGKGFPDINTRLFLNNLRIILSIPVFILVDADVYGIRIMITYKYGALSNSHISHYLAVPEAIWLGVFPSEITKLNITYLPLTDNDRAGINSLLKSPYVDNNQKLIEELQIMLTKNYKAEIEGLIKNNRYLSDSYLLSKIRSYNCIS